MAGKIKETTLTHITIGLVIQIVFLFITPLILGGSNDFMKTIFFLIFACIGSIIISWISRGIKLKYILALLFTIYNVLLSVVCLNIILFASGEGKVEMFFYNVIYFIFILTLILGKISMTNSVNDTSSNKLLGSIPIMHYTVMIFYIMGLIIGYSIKNKDKLQNRFRNFRERNRKTVMASRVATNTNVFPQ